MDFIGRFVLMPGARVQSAWLPWSPAADGAHFLVPPVVDTRG